LMRCACPRTVLVPLASWLAVVSIAREWDGKLGCVIVTCNACSAVLVLADTVARSAIWAQ